MKIIQHRGFLDQPMHMMFLVAIFVFTIFAAPASSAQITSEFTTITLDGRSVQLHYFHGLPANPEAPSLKIILFHGIPTGNSIFLPLMQELATLVNVETFAVSFPGFGRSDAPPISEFDYSEAILNDVPFLFADAVGVNEYLPISHDFGGAWLYCEAVKPDNLQKLVGLVVLNAPTSTPEEPFFSRTAVHDFARLTGDPDVSRVQVGLAQADLLQRGTASNIYTRRPGIVREISFTNTEPAHREAFEEIMRIGLDDPRGFGGECAQTFPVLTILNPLVIWALPDLEEHLLVYQQRWPTAEIVLLGDESSLSHFTPLDFEKEIAVAVAQYVQSITTTSWGLFLLLNP